MQPGIGVLPEEVMAEERAIEVPMHRRHQHAHDDDRDVEGTALARHLADGQREEPAAVGVVQHPDRGEDQRGGLEPVGPGQVADKKYHRRRYLHQPPAELRIQIEPEFRGGEAAIRALCEEASDDHERRERESRRQHGVVDGISGIPVHGVFLVSERGGRDANHKTVTCSTTPGGHPGYMPGGWAPGAR
ncbi:Uncharacterised protein [Mycobacteroides abscessus subsp. abscessus]|nr:Uncharacterised protein [Mycobacteroides abscessus subsp. abscessus]